MTSRERFEMYKGGVREGQKVKETSLQWTTSKTTSLKTTLKKYLWWL